MRTVAIAGVGLIGGSFALALRAAGFKGEMLGVSSPGTIAKAMQAGVIDRGCSLEEAASTADLVYLAQPVPVILEAIPKLTTCLKPGVLVTDAGSTKQAIVASARTHLPNGQFLGGHPMAGKELRGVEAADAALFQNRTYVLTPEGEMTAAMEQFVGWVRRIGARTVVLDPATHDRVVATTSHVPQLASTALSLLVREQLPDPAQQAIAGSGLRDMTRLAGSSFDVWEGILATNRDEIARSLSAYILILQRLQQELGYPELRESFEEGAEVTFSLRSGGF